MSTAKGVAGLGGDVRWLDDAEQEAWRWFVTAITVIDRELDRDLRVRHGLTHDDYAVLALLSSAPGERLRLGQLAAAVRMTKANLTHRVGRLEAEGIVVREPDPDDARGTYAQLTAAGRAVLEEAAPTHVTGVRERVLDPLTRDEFLELGRLSRRLVEANSDLPPEILGVRT